MIDIKLSCASILPFLSVFDLYFPVLQVAELQKSLPELAFIRSNYRLHKNTRFRKHVFIARQQSAH